jgi:hypothetical protein
VESIFRTIRLGFWLGAQGGLITLVVRWQAIVDDRRYAKFDAVLVWQYTIDRLWSSMSKSLSIVCIVQMSIVMQHRYHSNAAISRPPGPSRWLSHGVLMGTAVRAVWLSGQKSNAAAIYPDRTAKADVMAVDGAVAGDHAVAERTVLGEAEVAAVVPPQRVEFDERIVVQKGIDALAGGHLALNGHLLLHVWCRDGSHYRRSATVLGYGYTQDFLVEPVRRNATINRNYEGTNRIQRVVIVAGAAAQILAAFGLDSVPEVGGLGAPALRRRRPTMRALGVPAASNSGATSLIAAHSRLVLIAARGNHPHRTLTQVRRISSRGTAWQNRAVGWPRSLPGVLTLSAFK